MPVPPGFDDKSNKRIAKAVRYVERMTVDEDGPDEMGARSANQADVQFVQIVDGSQLGGTDYYLGKWETFDSADESVSTNPPDPAYVLLEFPAGFVPDGGVSYGARRQGDHAGTAVYRVFPDSGGSSSLTISAFDIGTQTTPTFAGISTLGIDETPDQSCLFFMRDDGDDPGTAVLYVSAVDGHQWGILSDGAQFILGAKTFGYDTDNPDFGVTIGIDTLGFAAAGFGSGFVSLVSASINAENYNYLQIGISGLTSYGPVLSVGLGLYDANGFPLWVVDNTGVYSCQSQIGLSTTSNGLVFTGGILTGTRLSGGVGIGPGVEFV